MRAKADGHEVKWAFYMSERTYRIGYGLVDRVSNWRDHVDWADLVVLADNTRYLKDIDILRARGVPVIGATFKASAWELDRKTGQEVFKKAGIPVPPFREFTSYDDAIAYVRKENRAFVSKPSYDESDKSLSYVAKTPADLVYMLTRWKRQQRLKGAFILQEKVKGCEMAVGAWFGPHGFSEGWCENWEFKSLMAGDRGPNVGEMGTVLRYVRSSKLARKVLAPLEDRLAALGYTGYVDVNCIIDEEGTPWPLEFTMRMGWPTFNIQQALNRGDAAEWLGALSDGRDVRPWRLDEISTGVVMALPEFPYGKTPLDKVLGAPIQGITSSMRDSVHPCQVQLGKSFVDRAGTVVEEPCWLTAGDYLLVASGTGDSVRQSRARAYSVMEKIRVPASPFWRPDIGERLKLQLPEIQKHGYASRLLF